MIRTDQKQEINGKNWTNIKLEKRPILYISQNEKIEVINFLEDVLFWLNRRTLDVIREFYQNWFKGFIYNAWNFFMQLNAI